MTFQKLCLYLWLKLKTMENQSGDTNQKVETNAPQNQNEAIDRNTQILYVLAVVMLISVFLPWLSSNTIANFGGYGGSVSIAIDGTKVSGGFIGAILSLLAAFFVFKQLPWSVACGIINLGIGVLVYFDKLSVAGATGSFDYAGVGGSASIHIDKGYGLYLFIAASAAFVFMDKNNINHFIGSFNKK